MPTTNKTKNLPPALSLLSVIGPSFILLGLALGSGELIFWPYLSANYGLGLIWGALLGISFQYLLNTEVMRYSLAWGESIFVGLSKKSKLLTIWFIISTFIPWSIPGFASASSQILAHLWPQINQTTTAIILLLLTGVVLSAGSTVYKTIETYQKISISIGLPLLLVLAWYLTSRQDWTEYAYGLIGKGDGWWFFPSGLAWASFLSAFAYSGAGGNLNLAQTYYVKEKGMGMGAHMPKMPSLFSEKSKVIAVDGTHFEDSALNRSRWQSWWRLVQVEHGIVFWFLGFLMISILVVVSKATVYGTDAAQGLTFLYTESAAIGAVLGTFWGTVFLLIAAAMLFSTQVGVLESSSRILSENVSLLWRSGPNTPINTSKWFYTALWSQILLGIVVYLSGFKEPQALLTTAALLNAGAMMTAFFIMLWLNTTKLKKPYRPGLFRKTGMVVAGLFFIAFLLILIFEGNH